MTPVERTRAFVLAAGLGTRLRPLTDHLPKALVRVGCRSLVGRVLDRIAEAGIPRAVVNAFHHADMLETHLATRRLPPILTVVREPVLLDTGGGLRNARAALGDAQHILVHNADVHSTIPLERLVADHAASGALATLAVLERAASRPLWVDGAGVLVRRGARGEPAPPGLRAVGYCGIAVVSAGWFERPHPEGAFPWIDDLLACVARGDTVRTWDARGFTWRDCGRLEDLRALEAEIRGPSTTSDSSAT